MKKIFTSFLCTAIFATTFAQWSPVAMHGKQLQANSDVKNYYSLDIEQIRKSLQNAEETGKGAKPVIINMPTLDGKIEKFAVYSFPVVVKSLADRYQLGSYVGVGIDDPEKYVRFSVAPNDFQSMILKDGKYEFIEPQNTSKTVYGVHAKTIRSGGKPFVCATTEALTSKEKIEKLFKNGNNFANRPTDFSRSSDRKYRTMRLAMSTTGEYTNYFNGVAGAITQINATMTRVNGIFENEFSLHLILQDFPSLIYTDAATDPYSPASQKENWSKELMNTLNASPGDDAFDIGHLFGATGGGGSAGCIGCVCNNTLATGGDANDSYKGSGYTSPLNGPPSGDTFDIDYVAHEMGHQLGANHTFSFRLEGYGVGIEPGSGSTIMGYAGITGSTNVQANSDPYFSIASILQVQNNLATRTCAIETDIPNNPPMVNALPAVTIPKSTAFALTASASDPENDPITYTWEQYDDATLAIKKTNLGDTTTGASFRSLKPTTNPTRYFPKLETVLSGTLKNTDEWEAVSTVARNSKFAVTVRDNSASSPGFQQTQYGVQVVTVGDDGPFTITSAKVYNNASAPFTWDTANTSNAPYNVANVKIDYTTDNGVTWNIVSESTLNDGSVDLNFSPMPTGSLLKVRVSAIENVFYTIKEVTVAEVGLCDGTAPKNIKVEDISHNSAKISWDLVNMATYSVRYKKLSEQSWVNINTNDSFVNITGLEDLAEYEVQVAAVCSGTVGNYSASSVFKTLSNSYCPIASGSSLLKYISNVKVTSEKGDVMNNASSASTYTNFASDESKQINLVANTTNNILEVTKAWLLFKSNVSIYAWIDFNRNGIYEASEQIAASPRDQITPVSITFSVPADAYVGGKTLGMRIILSDAATQADACTSFTAGEVEDYAVKITKSLAVNEDKKTQSIEIYPNPATDVLNISKVSDKASYSIYNIAGQLVANGKIIDRKIPVSKLEKGVYILNLNNNGETAKVKFIKK